MRICKICNETKEKFASKFICSDCKYKRYKERHPEAIKNDTLRKKNKLEQLKISDPEKYEECMNKRRIRANSYDKEKRRKAKELDMKENPEKYIVKTKEEKLLYKKKYHKEYREKHKDKIREELKKWRTKNKESIKKEKKEYYEKHKERDRPKRRKWQYENLQKDPQAKFKALLRTRVNAGFRLFSKNGKTTSCAEYGIDFEAIFEKLGPRPSEDYHLDHIIPMSLFNFDIKEHVQLCNCPENLRWVYWEDNLTKADKIIESIILSEPKLVEICKMLNIDIVS